MPNKNPSIAFDNVIFDSSLVVFFENHKENIINHWSIYPTLFDIRKKFGFTSDGFTHDVAEPVLNYFITIIRGENKPGDCPVMRHVIDQFYTKGMQVEDVFISCTAFKNVLMDLCTQHNISQQNLKSIIITLDHNLRSILAIYTSKLKEKEESLAAHARIIEEHVLLSVTDLEGTVMHVTDAFSELSGYSKEDWIGANHSIIRHPDMPEEIFEALWKTISAGNIWEGILRNKKKSGDLFVLKTKIIPVVDSHGEIIEYMAIREDITYKELSHFDPLTKIYNRRKFDHLMEEYFVKHLSQATPLSLILVDIDHFKNINDSYGHQTGDKILMQLAQIILNMTRAQDACCRWGGEEFAILLPHADLRLSYDVAERIRSRIEDTLSAEGESITCSLGVTQLKPTDTIPSMFKRADEALYMAKKAGRNQSITLR